MLADITATLAREKTLVLTAPTGAGKTTRVPRALLLAAAGTPEHEAREIVVLEPRRIAARFAAARVADELGEPLGERIGYTVRFESKGGPRVRVRFVTEGVLLRRLAEDPTLARVGTVLFDEFHERHLYGDVLLAALRRLQSTTRPDLRLLVMSATLASERVSSWLGAPILESLGRTFPLTIEHFEEDLPLEKLVSLALKNALARHEGDALVFLPGAREIRTVLEQLGPLARERDLDIATLHGNATSQEQDAALRKGSRRKVVLSTNVAESSLTIEGVRIVIDSGLARVASHSPWSGLPSLELAKISRASATQRAGRAGRTAPGLVVRLYTKADFDRRPEFDTPEIQRADLTQVYLELAALGMTDLAFLDPPGEASITHARELLVRLGALEEQDAADVPRVTRLGERMLRAPLHPRTARVLCAAEDRGAQHDGALLAALLEERDIRAERRTKFGGKPDLTHAVAHDSDLLAMADAFEEAEAGGFGGSAIRAAGLDLTTVNSVRRVRDRLTGAERREKRELTRPSDHARATEDDLLKCILQGFPDRVAKRKRPGDRMLVLADGGSAELAETSSVTQAEWMVTCVADTSNRTVPLVRTASAIDPNWLLDLDARALSEVDGLEWNAQKNRVESITRLLYGRLALVDERAKAKPSDAASRLLFEHARAAPFGVHKLVPEDGLERFLKRLAWAEKQGTSVRAPTALELDDVLESACSGRVSIEEIAAEELYQLILATFGTRDLDKLAPDSVRLPSGRVARVEYAVQSDPYVSSFLQDFCGLTETPKAGATPLLVHLLAPNKQAVQITTDLAGFWQRHYPAVRRELMRKYPRHGWPEDPSVPVPMKQRRR